MKTSDKFITFLSTLETTENTHLIESIKAGFNVIAEGIFSKSNEPYNLYAFLDEYGHDGFTADLADDDKLKFILDQGEAGWAFDGDINPVEYKASNSDGTIKVKGEIKALGDEDIANVSLSDVYVPSKDYWNLFN